MEWLTDPAAWLGLATLIVLEIVLGVDNLLFIAIVSEKLPPEQRDRARKIGLMLALGMRLGLLASISWVMSLTAPLFTVLGHAISWRDVILIVGGGFLLVKATVEIHSRIEGESHGEAGGHAVAARFWPIVGQIIILDIVFSLDSVITAVGMVDELAMMMAAVVIAVLVMLFASKALSEFINQHPSLVILALGFLLMVGFVLVADGFGFHIPKGYLYTAIAFSALIEGFNQTALRKRRRHAELIPVRQRTADTVLRLLGGVPLLPEPAAASPEASMPALRGGSESFAPAETHMVRSVLTLAERPVRAIMTPRRDVAWLDAGASSEAVLAALKERRHGQFVVGRGSLDAVVGIVRKDDVLAMCLDGGPVDLVRIARQPIVVPDGATILQALEVFKSAPVDMAAVVDEYGNLQGVVTRTDLLEAIAGNLPDHGEEPDAEELPDGSLLLDGAMSIYEAQQRLGLATLPPGNFDTVAGLFFALVGRIPAAGDQVEWEGWRFTAEKMAGWRVGKVRASRPGGEAAGAKA